MDPISSPFTPTVVKKNSLDTFFPFLGVSNGRTGQQSIDDNRDEID